MRSSIVRGRVVVGILLAGAFLLMGRTAPSSAQGPSTDLPAKALAILETNCGNSGCHGGADPYTFDVRDPATMVEAKVVIAGKGAESGLVRRLEAGVMPLGGYKGQAGAKLPASDIEVLRQWINAGAPFSSRVNAARRPFISEAQGLAAIIRDLESARPVDRPYLRYYNLANLWNSADVDTPDLAIYRAALGKLVNHLSWDREITQPKSLGPEGTIFRVDLRDYGWTNETWRQIIASYPYGLEPRNLLTQIERIQILSGANLPYVRVDWFITSASRAPLYHAILQLPTTVEALERQIGVNAEWEVERRMARRFGVRNSGVSRNNRAMERHATLSGSYWKSFDFAGNAPEQNIFRDPVELRADGGEMIFHLPNGLQGYFIADRQGKRIDDAPVSIVRDRTNLEDPVVHNGRSCIGCHVKGMNGFRDEISTTLQARTEGLFNLDIASALYPGQTELDRLIEQDNKRFAEALRRTGSPVPNGADDEPINKLARKYEGTLSVAQAAADLFLEDPKQLQQLIEHSSELKLQGFDQLLGSKGGVKRDTWEEGFGLVAGELRLGDFLTPTGEFRISHNVDRRLTVFLGRLSGPEDVAAQIRQRLLFWINQSDQLRLSPGGGADFNVTGSVGVTGRNQMTVEVRDNARGLTVSSSGAVEDIDFVAQQLANKLNFQITSAWLPTTSGTFSGVNVNNSSWTPVDPLSRLLGNLPANQSGRVILTTDLGPGATYRSGQDVWISFRSANAWFVTVFSIDANGRVFQLFPQPGTTPTRVAANQVVRLADWNGRSLARVDPNGVFGLETLVAVSSPTPGAFANAPTRTWESFSQAVRGVQDIAVLRFFTAP